MWAKPVAVEDQYRLIMEYRNQRANRLSMVYRARHQTRHILQLAKASPPEGDRPSCKWRGWKTNQTGSGKAWYSQAAALCLCVPASSSLVIWELSKWNIDRISGSGFIFDRCHPPDTATDRYGFSRCSWSGFWGMSYAKEHHRHWRDLHCLLLILTIFLSSSFLITVIKDETGRHVLPEVNAYE